MREACFMMITGALLAAAIAADVFLMWGCLCALHERRRGGARGASR